MSHLRKWWKVVLLAAAIVVAAQVAVSVLVRTHRLHNYLIAHLEKAFGRPVQVTHFNIEMLPSPRLYATGVTVGEDPAFGYEYFLRAENLTASLRWTGFLRGRFELGTLSLSQPSLTLVRNPQGRWNLEDWLPPAKRSAGEDGRAYDPVYGPNRAPAIANRLEKIEFDDGRIDFKNAEVKEPFALTQVNGSVEQVSSGRWKLRMEAQPWRSGVTLQSTETMRVQGDIAGTSARLQPASFTVRWDSVSLADLFRLLRGKDYGVRGTVMLEGSAKSGAPAAGAANPAPASDSFVADDWSFSLKASATQIHRWDLSERDDNPDLTATVQGRWNVALGKLTAEKVLIETPLSNVHATAEFRSAAAPFIQARVDSAGIQAGDVLAWYRAFHSGVAEGITADEYFSGSLALQGWPVKLQAMDFSTSGGRVNIRGMDSAVTVGPGRAVFDQARLVVNPVRLSFLHAPVAIGRSGRNGTTTASRLVEKSVDEVSVGLIHNFLTHGGELDIQGQVADAKNVLSVAAAFGYTLSRGWDLTGPAHANLRREWPSSSRGNWNGEIDVSGAKLAAAGLNQPVELQQARLMWLNGRRRAQIFRAEGFGATWSGNIFEDDPANPYRGGAWLAILNADHLDASELDRWVGPRSRPGWLERLLPSLLGGKAKVASGSELVGSLNVAGELRVDEFTIEKLKLQQVHLQGSLHDLQLDVPDGQAQWAGGVVRASMTAKFLPRPRYDVEARLTGVDLTQLPIAASVASRLGGVASGTLHLKTAGVGREELLQKLSGTGDMHVANLEFRGWDVNASVADGEAHAGVSRWAAGDGDFSVGDRSVALEDVRLDGGAEVTLINGTVSFDRDADLSVETSTGRRAVRNTSAPGQALKIVGPLDGPRVTRAKTSPREPAD
jgi:AsmA family/AsmA-like C-terminal region